MRWGVEKRLEFIEFRLFWEGGINRADIMEQFGVSTPQASKDLNLYEQEAPGNLVYDKSAKKYAASPKFKPIFLDPKADTYLSYLNREKASASVSGDTWLSVEPDVDVLPIPRRQVLPDVLRSVVAAINHNQALEIDYQSMSAKNPDAKLRWVTPHAFGSDGFRWHVRAYCHIDEKFKDFILSRILKVKKVGDPGALPESDRYWSSSFQVTLIPNPELSQPQQDVIAHDYHMDKGKVEVEVRDALLYYFQKRLRLDLDYRDQPHETPVVVENRADFDKALSEAMS